MSKQTLAALYQDYLSEEGYRPKMDEDGAIGFKHEGNTHFIDIDEGDETFFRLSCYLWPVETEEEREKALRAANEATLTTKVAKAYLLDDMVVCAVELFMPTPESFRDVFERAMYAMQSCATTFLTAIEKADGTCPEL